MVILIFDRVITNTRQSINMIRTISKLTWRHIKSNKLFGRQSKSANKTHHYGTNKSSSTNGAPPDPYSNVENGLKLINKGFKIGGCGAVATAVLFRPIVDHIACYRCAHNLFEGSQPYANEDYPPANQFVNRKTRDVEKIRSELTSQPYMLFPYPVTIHGPSRSGKSTLMKECTKNPGVRRVDLKHFDSLGRLLQGNVKKAFWERVLRIELDPKEEFERQKDLILEAAENYTRKHRHAAILIFDNIRVKLGDEDTRFVSLRNWAQQHQTRIKFVFVTKDTKSPIVNPMLKRLEIGEFTKNEAKEFLRKKFDVEKRKDAVFDVLSTPWSMQVNSSDVGPIWARSTDAEVIAELNYCVDHNIGNWQSLLKCTPKERPSIGSVNHVAEKMKEMLTLNSAATKISPSKANHATNHIVRAQKPQSRDLLEIESKTQKKVREVVRDLNKKTNARDIYRFLYFV